MLVFILQLPLIEVLQYSPFELYHRLHNLRAVRVEACLNQPCSLTCARQLVLLACGDSPEVRRHRCRPTTNACYRLFPSHHHHLSLLPTSVLPPETPKRHFPLYSTVSVRKSAIFNAWPSPSKTGVEDTSLPSVCLCAVQVPTSVRYHQRAVRENGRDLVVSPGQCSLTSRRTATYVVQRWRSGRVHHIARVDAAVAWAACFCGACHATIAVYTRGMMRSLVLDSGRGCNS